MFTHKQTRSAGDSSMKRHSYRVEAIISAIVVAVVAAAFYQVRELAAALLIFSVLFSTVGMAFLILFLIQELALRALIRIETSMAHIRGQNTVASPQPHRNSMARSSR